MVKKTSFVSRLFLAWLVMNIALSGCSTISSMLPSGSQYVAQASVPTNATPTLTPFLPVASTATLAATATPRETSTPSITPTP